MQYLYTSFPIIITAISVAAVMKYIAYRNKKAPDDHIVRPSVVGLIVIILGILFFSGLTIVLIFVGELLIGWIISLIFVILDFILLIGIINNKILYNEKSFEYIGFWGKRKSYQYTDVVSYASGKTIILFLNNGKKIKLDYVYQNRERFLQAVIEGYYQATGRPLLPAYYNN